MAPARWLAATLALALGACGGSNFDGTVQGHGLDVKDALLITGADPLGPFVHVHLTDREGVCGMVRGGRQPHGMTSLVLEFAANAQGRLEPGDYPVSRPGLLPVPGHATARFYKTDERCESTLAGVGFGVSGKVTLESIDADHAQGEFDVVFDTGDHATGEFDAEACRGAGMDSTICD